MNLIYYIQQKFKDAVEILIIGEKDSRSLVQPLTIFFGIFK